MRYCPYFCEENVWHLCRDDGVVDENGPVPRSRRRVVFVSNAQRQVRMRHQRAGRGGAVVWDYHVILLAAGRSGWSVWDLDCDTGMPLPLSVWLDASFDTDTERGARFRVIDAAEFLAVFSSDRSHMHDGSVPFPAWPPIVDANASMNLMRFVDLDAAFIGTVVDVTGLRSLPG